MKKEDLPKPEYIFHVRPHDVYCHPLSHGGITVAAVKCGNKSQHTEWLSWGMSRCHNVDNFCKHTGRVKAIGRAISTKYSFKTEMMNYEQACTFASNMSKESRSKKLIPLEKDIKEAIKISKKLESDIVTA